MDIITRYIYRRSKYPISPLKIYRDLLVSQYADRLDLDLLVRNKLCSLIQKSAFYKSKFSKSKIFSLSDIKELPTTEKSVLQNKGDALYNLDYRGVKHRHKTSGSTGIPTMVDISSHAEAYRIALRLRFREWWGLKPRSRGVLLWGGKKSKLDLKSRLKKLFSVTLFIPIFEVNNETIIDHYNAVLSFRPEFIRGYKSAVVQFALLCEKAGLSLKRLDLKVVITTSEVLLPTDRELLERIFGCRVANEYGAVEAGLFAYECPSGGLHVNEEAVFCFSNESNELISTELHNDCQILVNFLTGDKVFFKDEICECGRTLKLIDHIEGRSGDTILRPNGEEISQYLFYYFFKELPNELQNVVAQYKVVQEDRKFHVYLVSDSSRLPQIKTMLENLMRTEIGETIDVVFYAVEDIPRESSGKIRFFNRIK